MRLTYVLIFLIIFTISSASAWFFTVQQSPEKVMERIENSISGRAGGFNSCFHFRKYGPHNGTVKRSNPDVLATSMAYDVSEGGVRISGPSWMHYWSLSLYQHNTDNIYILSESDIKTNAFEVLILAKGRKQPPNFKGEVVYSPTTTGVAIIRRYIPGVEYVESAMNNQDQLVCQELAGNT